MATRRYVRENRDGAWEVLREGERRSTVVVPTKTKARTRAREIVRAAGGGEVRILDRMGKITDLIKVSRTPSKTNA
jgi:Uncharacterized protein conserved in bacteria (DUF2188)